MDEIYLDLAFEHENLEEFDEALNCLKKAVELNPENEAVLLGLACMLRPGLRGGSVRGLLPQFASPTSNTVLRSAGSAWATCWRNWTAWKRATRRSTSRSPSMTASPAPTSAEHATCSSSAVTRDAINCYEETLVFDGPQAITFSFVGECYGEDGAV
ncbi:MAG: tetratricopeptide repeat protein [Flavobacteriales bacterium]|nr:tetratricopeptide repeat protein [Flavobacteriales bacterium]